MTALYVIGGRQRQARTLRDGSQPWAGYDRGLVLSVDPETQAVSTVFSYDGNGLVHGRPEDELPAVSFQASQLHGDVLYTCTETEVMLCRVPGFELLAYVSLPFFNDVHHVRPSVDGNILVANAGLEMVLELDGAGSVLQAWNVLGEDPWTRIDPHVDYRWISTKPHRAHPNFLFYLDDELWATRFHQGDAVSLSRPGRSVAISDRRIHDGLVSHGLVWFTTVDGHVVAVDPHNLEVAEQFDLNLLHDERDLLGWCRGIHVEGSRLWVGFSRIRATKFRENVGWVARGFRRDRETHIACYDLRRRECVAEIDLEQAGMAAVYSILPAP